MNTPSKTRPHQKLKATRIGLGIIALVLVTTGMGDLPLMAQSPNQWTPDERVPGYFNDTPTPYLVVDDNRTVHAFVSQWVGEENEKMAVVYRQWSLKGGWTTPVDILLAPDGDARVLGAFLDKAGIMHIAFVGSAGRAAQVYYSKAPVASAGQAPAWSAPKLVGEGPSNPPSGALTGDGKGNLVLIYSGNTSGNGVYELHSFDAGDSWSKPDPIFLTYDPESVPFSVRATMGQKEQVHAVWNVVTDQGVDMSVRYARLDLADQLWSDAILLEEGVGKPGFFGPSFPAVVDTGENVIVMYNSGNPDEGGPVRAGRPVQRVTMSSDGGRTWSRPVTPFPRQLGRSGEHSLVVDGNKVAHVLFMQRVETSSDGENRVIDGPWHSELSGDQWSEPDRFPARWSPHDLRAAIVQGNVLLVTWRQDPGEGQSGVWY